MKEHYSVFDFDGTIYNKDSIIETSKFFYKRNPHLLFFVLFQIGFFALSKFRIISKTKFKELFCYYLKFMSKEEIELFWENEFPKNFNKIILQVIQENNEKGIKNICLSASVDFIIADFLLKKLNFSQVITNNLIFTDRIPRFENKINCRGKEKIVRLFHKIDKKDFEILEAYSDNSDDIELLKLAYNGYWVNNSIIKNIYNGTNTKTTA